MILTRVKDEYMMKLTRYMVILLILMAVIVVPFTVSTVGDAFAHASPILYSPPPDTNFQEGQPLPSEVAIIFSERPDPVTSYIHVIDSQNQRVDNDDFTVTGDHNDREAMVTMDPASLTDGIYTVSWRALSLDDGHITRGSFVFGVGDIAAVGETPATVPGAEIEPVTATFDGILKGILIVAQVAVVGSIVGHMVLWRKFSRAAISGNNNQISKDDAEIAKSASRRLTWILISSGIAIMITGTALMSLQAHTLSADIGETFSSTFASLIFTPVGTVWILRMIASVAIIAAAAVMLYSKLRKTKKEEAVGPVAVVNIYPIPLLIIVLLSGSVAIFSNSMVSHSAAVQFFPLVSIAADWVHIMAVAVWIGGLFYIASVMLTAVRSKSRSMLSYSSKEFGIKSRGNKKEHSQRINSYYFALLLPYFSLLATASLGVIAVTGLYLAWIHLQVPESLFETQYGNILIIKLAAIIPLVVLGGYHQLKVHRSMMSVAVEARNISGRGGSSGTASTTTTNDRPSLIGNGGRAPKKGDDYSAAERFGKTIKAESLIAIAVLIIASFLTITPPPSLTGHHDLGAGTPVHGQEHIEGVSSFTSRSTVMDANIGLEITPFYAGYNHFIVTITDEDGESMAQEISNVMMIFNNRERGIGPIIQDMIPDLEGVYHLSGGFLSQPGNWEIRITAQRIGAYDLNYRLQEDVPEVAPSLLETTDQDEIEGQQQQPPADESFTILAILLSGAVIAGSTLYFIKSKRQLGLAAALLKE